MAQYLVLLRGINVGGKNIIPMAHLRDTLEKAKYVDVSTLIQSGNVILTAPGNAADLEKALAKLLKKTYSYEAQVMVRTKADMTKLAAALPKLKKSHDKQNTLFLDRDLTAKKFIKEIDSKPEYEELIAAGRDVIWTTTLAKFGRSAMGKFAGSNPYYKKATIRNMNTTRKLIDLMTK